jgi:predicted dehydrogenase
MSSAESAPLNVGVLGLGFMGSTHVKALRAVSGARLAAVFGHDERALAGDFTAVRGNFGGPGEKLDFSEVRKYRDVDALLADGNIDAVDICLPTDLHADVAIRALRAGKHVLCEKPMALDRAAADRMIEEADRQGRILMVAQVLRYWPQYVALREALRGGALGAVRTAKFLRVSATPGWGGWLLDPARSGGGIFDLLIHDVDICLHLFGKPESVAATGVVNMTGIDSLVANLFYADGLTASITGGWFPEPLPFQMAFSVEMECGKLDWISTGGALTLSAADGATRELPVRETDAYAAEIADFVDCCRTGRPSEICPPRESADAVALMRLLEDARRSNGEKLPCRI